ncbi:XRE family transcriptional regulator [Embleya scabrispora]|uniref:XRE family transcriptional regulator n=1 Tax=Embleya scabrispora TaxID=159449 RepID=UPI00117E7B87|nr:XRE family transcriptional regulator [Embleya scabrispora]
MTVRDDGAPRPDTATTAAEYVAALRELREWSALTYRQLAAKAEASGRVLPASTVAAALGRATLPRAELVEALVIACGLDAADAAHWLEVRDDLAAGRVVERAEETEPLPPPPAEPPVEPTAKRRRPWMWPAAAVVAAAMIATAVIFAVRGDGGDHLDAPRGRLPDGKYLIKPAHIPDGSLCLGEGRERNGRTDRPIAVQRSCKNVFPDTYLVVVAPDVYQIEWRNPVDGVGCLRVDDAMMGPGGLLSPIDCTGAAHQRFLFEPVDPGIFRMRPVHSGLCVGIIGGPAEISDGAEAEQSTCSGAADQRFRLERVR